jgi:hypothetical protein
MNVTRRPTASLVTEQLDVETQELLDAIDVELPEFGDVDLDVAFGTPLDMYEPAGSPRETRRYAAAVVACPPELRLQLSMDAGTELAARRDAARDIAADDPGIARRVRERLVDVLLPYATHLAPTDRPFGAEPALPLAA